MNSEFDKMDQPIVDIELYALSHTFFFECYSVWTTNLRD